MKVRSYSNPDWSGHWCAEFNGLDWKDMHDWCIIHGGEVTPYWVGQERYGQVRFKTSQELVTFMLRWS
jgi:hypothetical protein